MLPRCLSWDRYTGTAAASLICLWAALFAATWGHWGNVTIDCGREMYVPAALLAGKTLYRDVWYLYGPAAPYFNSLLYGVFGVHLNVLYWAGALSALGCAWLLLLTGMRFGAWMAGWTAATVVLCQAFFPSLFSFPLAYSYAAVYGCLLSCLLLWLLVNAAAKPGWPWMFAAGCTAAAALSLKVEYGTASYSVLAFFIVARSFQRQSLRSIWRDALAVLPGMLAAFAVVVWMVSLRGADFITQENLMSWPSAWFMQRYGREWLRGSGFALGFDSLAKASVQIAYLAGVCAVLRTIFYRTHDDKLWAPAGPIAVGVAALGALLLQAQVKAQILQGIFFPRPMVLLVALAAVPAILIFWRRGFDGHMLAVTTLFVYSAVLAFRVLLSMVPFNYAIYYNGPVVLSFLLLVRWLVMSPAPRASASGLCKSEAVFSVCVVLTVALVLQTDYRQAQNWAPLVTSRGTVYMPPEKVDSYRAAVAFMRSQADAGKQTLTVPEDTALYFFSATLCPSRVFALTPGTLAPGKMTSEYIREVDAHRVEYLLWSNRTYEEYGVPIFGLDFDEPVGEYFRNRFHPVTPLPKPQETKGWAAGIWQRNQEVKAP